ncbi:hypothetical protein R1sor_013525 [Riccia sorocarpa]|uniref:Acetyl-CoA acetyltransferase n=1 Tax=Riccia sorocarpa TaxID=122646 RepID=A0ABD3H8P0_9MARC
MCWWTFPSVKVSIEGVCSSPFFFFHLGMLRRRERTSDRNRTNKNHLDFGNFLEKPERGTPPAVGRFETWLLNEMLLLLVQALKALLEISSEYGWQTKFTVVSCGLHVVCSTVLFDFVLSELEEGAVRSQKQFPGSEKMRAVATSLCLAEASECYDLAFKQGLPGVGKTLFKSIRTVMYRDVMSGRLDGQLLEDVVGGLDKLAGLEKLACTYAHPQEEYMELVSVTLASKGLDTSKTGETLKTCQIQLRWLGLPKDITLGLAVGSRGGGNVPRGACDVQAALFLILLGKCSAYHDALAELGGEEFSDYIRLFPYRLPKARRGYRRGHGEVVDGMIKDGLWDVYSDKGMGVCGELCAENHSISRAQQDDYSIQSYERAIAATNAGVFQWEVVPVEVPGARGKPSVIVAKDDGVDKLDAAKLRKLRPAFKEGGTVTAGNASSISDGAAALVLVSGKYALEKGLTVIAKVRGYADAEQAPELFTTSPALAIPKAIKRAGIDASQVDFYEINEAFSVVALANQKLLGLDSAKVNVHGGAVSLGHPLGCSGARVIVTLLSVLKAKQGTYGVAGVCSGGGGASALVVELTPTFATSHL